MTLRAIIIGFTLVIIQTAVIPYNDYYLQNTELASSYLPLGPLLALIILTLGINTILRKTMPGAALTEGELITIWMVMVVSSAIPAKSGMMGYMLSFSAAPNYFATPENEWASLLHPYLPEWLVVWDKGAAVTFYEGDSPIPLAAWIKPLFVWTTFIMTLYFVMICLSVILRKQWVEHERFTFPLVALPVEIARQTKSTSLLSDFFLNKLMWVGFLIPATLHLINGLHQYFPSVPFIPTQFNLYESSSGKPWRVLGWWPRLRFFVAFSVIGISYFLTQEIAFSCWFFFLFYKFQSMMIDTFSIPINPSWDFAAGQVMAVYPVLVCLFLLKNRAHIKDILRQTFSEKGKSKAVNDADEPLPYRSAFFGLILGFLLLVSLWVYIGMAPWIAFVVMGTFLSVSTVLTWMVVNGGLLLVESPVHPWAYIEVLFGTRKIDAYNLVPLSFQRGVMHHLGRVLMPSVLHGFKAADLVRLNRRHLLGAIALAIILALGVSYVSLLSLTYEKGAVNLHREMFVRPRAYLNGIVSLIQHPHDTSWKQVYTMVFGLGIISFLLFMRGRFLWWKLHPIGYAMGGVTYAAYFLWSSIFIAWLLKYLILKFGGIRQYRHLRPLFMGLILGEYCISGLWMIMGAFTGVSYHVLGT